MTELDDFLFPKEQKGVDWVFVGGLAAVAFVVVAIVAFNLLFAI